VALYWPSVKIAGKRVPYIPVTLILIVLGASKKKNKTLTAKESQEKI
jgi:hypothetical protein